MSTVKRKLIEVALPLEAINRESAREKSIRHGHPSTLHLWWARRPLAAARAVLFAQLVDDPSSRPEEFPTEEAQSRERKRLFALMERLVSWDNLGDEVLFHEARQEVLRSTGGQPPGIMDPFAGGGSIPLEAQRLGLEAFASDLNPVAVLINRALIEIPARWSGQSPVFPGAAGARLGPWVRATGLAEDVRSYGEWIRTQAETRIGSYFPRTTLPDGSSATTIAWIWARTVACPNPACEAEIPLASSWWLSKKKDRPTWLLPVVNGSHIGFEVVVDSSGPPDAPKLGRGAKFRCLVCGDATTDAYVKSEANAGRMSARLLAIVAEGDRQRIYVTGSDTDERLASSCPVPLDIPDAQMPDNPRWFSPPAFGLTTFADLFTPRQLLALTTFSDLVDEARMKVLADASDSGMSEQDSADYADGVALYLAFGVSRQADYLSSLCPWAPDPKNEGVIHAFGRQALPMVWDYAEANPFSDSSGNWRFMLRGIVRVLESLPAGPLPGHASQSAAQNLQLEPGRLVATDPPYYDNIGYADLSDFFYIWLRRSLAGRQGSVTATMLTPKTEELIASAHRFGGSREGAERHFETGFNATFQRIASAHECDAPLTLFYAFKQAETDDGGTASTGWETMLNGLIASGYMVTATWPMRTERAGRMVGNGTNALASSVVLACRPRTATAEAANRRTFIHALQAELPGALRRLQEGSLAPVDLAQAAIGPGMAIFTRYTKVVEADGSDMSVRTALALINQVLDEVLAEQEGDFDGDTRFCIKWFSQFGWNDGSAGDADVLARATNTSVDGLVRGGVFKAVAGKATLIGPGDLSEGWDPAIDERVSDWEVATRLANELAQSGVESAARLMALASQRRDLDTVKELAYLLFSIAEKRGWTQTALLFNGLGTAWNDLESAARVGGHRPEVSQEALAFDESI